MRPVYVDTLSAVTVNRPVLVSFLVFVCSFFHFLG